MASLMSVIKEELHNAFAQNKERGTATGFRLHGRQSLLIACIEELVDTAEHSYVIISECSIYGERLTRTRISFDEIEKVLCLRIRYNDPFYLKLRALRQNVSLLRHNSGERSISFS